jgi:sialic acid synthase SpsE
LLINIVIKGNDPFPSEFDWLYFGSDDVPFHRVGMQSRFSRKGLEDDTHIMCCEISYTKKPSTKKIERWLKESTNYLIKNNLIKEDEIVSTNIHDAGPVYPGYFGGHEEEVSRVNSELGRLSNYYLLGSLAEYAYSDLQVLTAKAIDLAEELSTSNKTIKSEIIKEENTTLPASSFKFGNQLISFNKNDPVFVIAEIGLCHNGSVDLCKKLILASKESGFNAAKIQTYVPGRISKKTRTSRYYEETLDAEESISSMLDRIIFSRKELTEIFSYANKVGIELFSTPFDAESVKILEDQNVSGYKISSMDLVNAPLIREVCKTGKPVILSSGMASMSHIENAISLCLSMGTSEISVLHCVSSYPCPLEMANLSRIKRISDSFGVITGFSDHTLETITPSLAVSLGARVIEKHVTLGKEMDGPDHNFSLVPDEMIEMVDLIRKTEKALNSHQMDISSSELNAKQNLRRSIYAAREIHPGERLCRDSLVIKSPGDGIPADQYDFILDKELKVGIKEDFPLKWENLFD